MLKSLEIQGFKSFPDPTLIEFHKGITAIVGPNGAGKSNITDAIRWVLGEQSAKTLRGQRMEDVIFDGTAQRRPVSFSEVTLTFDNAKKILPIDYETVAITRRYYRSGDSEYLINQTPCRLKDINSLLMDTAVGLDGYSIIGQGRVDDILSHKSEDRRAIFEEASGIVQYRTRKDEALRKLERSQQNLIRVDDLLAELGDQEEVLEKQAEDARSHLTLATRYRKLDLALTLRQLASLEETRAKKEEEAALLKADLDEARRTQGDRRSGHEAQLAHMTELDQRIEKEQGRFNDLSVKETEHTGLDALYKEKYAASKEGAESLLEEKNRLLIEVMAAEQDVAGRAQKRDELIRNRQALEREVAGKRDSLAELLKDLEQIKDEVSKAGGLQRNLLDSLSDLRAVLKETGGERLALRARQEDLTKETAALSIERDEAEKGLAAARLELDDRTRQIDDLETESAEAGVRTRAGHLLADQIEGALEAVRSEIRQLTYEAETLERLEEDFEGYSNPVRQIMKEQKKTKRAGLYGPLGSLLTVEESLQQAIEVALGGASHHLVCQDQATAEFWIDWLRRTRQGRATFLPAQSLSVSTADRQTLETARRGSGWIGLASDLVLCGKEIKPAVDFTLGRTLLVETLEDAVSLSHAIRQRYTVVTREGDVVHRGGSMTGGHRMVRSAGVLGRPGRIQAAREEARLKKARILELEKELILAKDALQEQAAKEARLLEDLAVGRRELVRVKAEEVAGEQAFQRIVADLERRDEEARRVQARIDELDREGERLRTAIAAGEAEHKGLESGLERLQATYQSALDQHDSRRIEVTRLDFQISSAAESLAEFDAQTARTGKEIESAQIRLASVEREWEQLTARMEEARHHLEANDRALEEVRQRTRECQADLDDLYARREEAFSSQRALLDSLDDASDRVASLQSVFERRSGEVERTGQQLDDLLNRLWETHGTTRAEAQAEAAEITSVTQANLERAELKRRIESLGPINHKAISDYEHLKERMDYAHAQRQDIEKAQAELQGVIRELEQAMREQFTATIHEVNQNFNQVFSELFSGGQAELVLDDDEDVLQADIGIRAQPPGKKLQKLSLLSGGERCLTAIALLFAILKLKPTPFCVFDEVESALDDANVKRFTDYVRRYAWSMQFILVTHRKGTMEAADRLYGVTMQERGISRVVSMILSSALPFGE